MNNDNKRNGRLIAVICALALACVFAILVFSGIIDLNKITAEETPTDPFDGFMSESYADNIKMKDSNNLPYLKTDIENIFYTIDVNGAVKFYKFEDAAFKAVDATGTYSTSVKLSETYISADITYYKSDDKICGFGLYTTDDENAYTLYPYAFFCLRNYGSEYKGSNSSTCLLLVDTTQEDFYSNNKIYEESFKFKFSDSSVTRSISEASRTVGINGAKRDDYFAINDTTVNNSYEHQLFFSGRYYAESDTKVDIMRTGGRGNNTDNIRVVKDALCYWLHNDGKNLIYISADSNENVIVSKYEWSSGNTETIKTFDGVKRDDILVSGNYMYVISKNVIYNLIEDKDISLSYNKINELVVDSFTVNNDKLFICGFVNDLYPVVIFADGLTGNVTASYANELFKNIANPVVFDNDNFMFTVENIDGYDFYLF